ncbi:MAG TPA: hypothetical protein VF937_16135, partial [Chloroflexota bacterium]
VIVTIAAIWGLMTSTGLLRGEEDAGRWELMLVGPTTRRGATAQALAGLGAALAAMLLAAALLTLLAGRLPGARFSVAGSLLFAVAMISGAAMFVSVGAVLSQLSATRGQALTIGAIGLGASFSVRMVADSNTSLAWLRWLSPIGWLEELRPLQDSQPLALIPVVGLILVCGGLTVLLAGRRDLYASILRERASARSPLSRWLTGPTSLAVRLTSPSAVAWLVGVASMGLMYGSLARSAARILSSSSVISTALSRLGVRKASEGYLAVVFLIVAVLISVIAASQIAAIRDEEASGRLDNLLVRPVRRSTWLLGRAAVALALVVVAGGAAGLFAWMGAASQHTGVELSSLLEAGLNATVPAVFVLGVGVLVVGVRPRLAAPAVYGIVAWSFLVDLLGSLIKGHDWLRNSSLFTHIALAPAASPDWTKAAAIVALAICATAIGVLVFARRDVEYA